MYLALPFFACILSTPAVVGGRGGLDATAALAPVPRAAEEEEEEE